MYIKKKNKFRLLLLVIVVLGFIYWRGAKSYVKQNHMDCKFHLVYAVCSSSGKTAFPSFLDALKAGVKF